MNADQRQIRVSEITIGVPFEEIGKCRDKSVQEGVDEYLSILPEDANIQTDLFHLSPKLEKANSSSSNQRET